MDPGYIKHAWQSYSQGDMSITKTQDGTGLGLSICKNLVEINGEKIHVESQLKKGSKFWFTWNVELLSIAPSLLNTTHFDQISYSLPNVIKQKRTLIVHPLEDARNALLNYLKVIEKVDAFDTLDKGINAAKSYIELNNQSAYDLVVIGLYKNNEEEVMKATLELRRLEANSNNLGIIFIVFPNNEENELAEKVIGKVGGTATVLHTPITWKKLINLLMHMEGNYSTIDKNNKSLHVKENFQKRVADYEYADQDIYENLTENDSKISKCILCVDDNPISLENTLRQVSKLGYSTISATNGLEAIKLIDSKSKLLSDTYTSSSFYSDINPMKPQKISLILTEYNLPVMSGFDVSQAIRATKPPISNIPIIVLTASPVEEIRDNCIESDINDYLAKPLKTEELENVLTKWI
ncbi:28649_t:CDS:2, partial [Racocetra persica]